MNLAAHFPCFPRNTLLIILDGMEDTAYPSLGGMTPLEAADAPALHALMRKADVSRFETVPAGMEVTSENAILSILGYDVAANPPSRGALEAVGLGIDLNDGEVAGRCSLVTKEEGLIVSTQAGGVTAPEAWEIAGLIVSSGILPEGWRWISGHDHRHLLIMPELVYNYSFPAQAEMLERKLMDMEVMKRLNGRRKKEGRLPVNGLWFWGFGKMPPYPDFCDAHGLSDGCVIAGAGLLKGIARAVGLEAPRIEGATGDIHTDLKEKARRTVAAMRSHDFTLLHVEATDEASHLKDERLKRSVIEKIDRELIGTIMAERGGRNIILLSDHASLCRTGQHARGAITACCLQG